MKRTSLLHIVIMVMAVLVAACKSNDINELNTDQGEKTIQFCVANYKQYPLDDVLQGDEMESRTTRATTAVALDNLSMTVFDAEGKLYPQVKQTKGIDGYGTFSLTLPNGNYVIVFFGYNGDKEVEIVSPTDIHFADGYAPNCFCKALTLNVDDNTQNTQTIVLERPVACFHLDFTNASTPSSLNRIDYTVEGCGTALNAMTGLASNTNVRNGSIDLSSVKDIKNFNLSIYTFLPQTELKATFTLTAADATGQVLKTRTFKDVPMKINQKTCYTGDFFADDNDPTNDDGIKFTLQYDDNWEEINYTY